MNEVWKARALLDSFNSRGLESGKAVRVKISDFALDVILSNLKMEIEVDVLDGFTHKLCIRGNK